MSHGWWVVTDSCTSLLYRLLLVFCHPGFPRSGALTGFCPYKSTNFVKIQIFDDHCSTTTKPIHKISHHKLHVIPPTLRILSKTHTDIIFQSYFVRRHRGHGLFWMAARGWWNRSRFGRWTLAGGRWWIVERCELVHHRDDRRSHRSWYFWQYCWSTKRWRAYRSNYRGGSICSPIIIHIYFISSIYSEIKFFPNKLVRDSFSIFHEYFTNYNKTLCVISYWDMIIWVWWIIPCRIKNKFCVKPTSSFLSCNFVFQFILFYFMVCVGVGIGKTKKKAKNPVKFLLAKSTS